MFKNYKLEVENQKRKKIKILISNKGGEYFSWSFLHFVKKMESYIKLALHIHLNKMARRKERIEHLLIYLY
jgi:hypothetical protein